MILLLCLPSAKTNNFVPIVPGMPWIWKLYIPIIPFLYQIMEHSGQSQGCWSFLVLGEQRKRIVFFLLLSMAVLLMWCLKPPELLELWRSSCTNMLSQASTVPNDVNETLISRSSTAGLVFMGNKFSQLFSKPFWTQFSITPRQRYPDMRWFIRFRFNISVSLVKILVKN